MPRSIIACRKASYGAFESIAYEHLASLGVRHVEIPVPPVEQLDAVRGELSEFGLSTTTMHGACDVTRADIAEAVVAQMPAFKALGCRLMFVSVKSGETPRDTVIGRLREAGDAAAAHGVTIVMETHPDLATNGEVAAATMRSVNHPNVRINYDTANIYFYNRGADGLAELRKVVEFVAAMHLKDTDGGYRNWHFPALGRGVVDFAGTFALLDEVGFNGPCTMEIEGISGETATRDLVCARMAESVAYLRSLGRF